MVDIFAQEKIQPKDIFAAEGISPVYRPQVISLDAPDMEPVKQEVDSHKSQYEQLAAARFSEDQIKEWKSKPIGFSEASDFLSWEDVVPLGGIKKGYDTYGIYSSAKKLEAGEEITPEESEKINKFIDKTIEMNLRGFSVGGGIAYYGASLPAFMTEFALTAGAGKAVQVATVQAATKIAEKAALKTAVATTAAKTTGIAARVAAQTALMPSLYVPKFAERRLNDAMAITDKGEIILKESKETPAISALKAFSHSSAEVASELSGAAIGKYVVSPVAKRLGTPIATAAEKLPVKLRQGIYEAYKKIQPNATVSKVFSRAGFNGMINELGEERVADVMRETLNLALEDGYTFDQVLDGITPSKDQLLTEAGIVSIAGGAHTSTNILLNTLQNRGMSSGEAIEVVNNLSASEKETLEQKELPDPIGEYQPPQVLDKESDIVESQISSYHNDSPPLINNSDSFFNKEYAAWFDSLDPVKDAVLEAEQKGQVITAGTNAYKLARTFSGIVGKTRVNLQNYTFYTDESGNAVITGKGFKPIIDDFENSVSTIEKNSEVRKEDFKDYLIARRYLEDLQGRANVEVSTEQIAESAGKMARLADKYGESFEWFDTFARETYDFQKRILNNLVTSGVMSKDTYDTIVRDNPNYVPFQRVLDEHEIKEALTSKGVFTNASMDKVIKKIKGSEKDVKDPMQSIIMNTAKIMRLSEENKVALQVAKLTEALPEYIQKESPDSVQPKNTKQITVFENGVRSKYYVSDPIHQALTQMNPIQLGFLERIFSVQAQLLRAGATLIPEFWSRNIIRDQFSAVIQSKARATPIDMVRGLTAVMKKNDLYKEWMAAGGSFNSYMELDDKGLEKAYYELFNPQGKLARYAKNALRIPADISGALEQATRIGIYSKSKAAGMSDIDAALEAREGTLDFARGGYKAKTINRYVPFFNAGMQGVDKLIRTFKSNPKATTAWAVGTITMPSVILTGYYLYGAPEDEREEYLEIPQWQKDLFWVFKVNDQWMMLPKPFTLGYVFGSVPERFMTWMYDEDKPEGKEFWLDTIKGIGGAFSPVYDASSLMPPMVKVAVESAANYNFFFGEDIYPEWMDNLEPELRKKPSTSDTAVLLGETFNTSPAIIDNAIRGTLAGSSRYVTDAGDTIINQIKKWNGQEIPEEPDSVSDIPLVRAFVVREPVGYRSNSTQSFFKLYNEVETKHNSYDHFTGDKKEEYFQKNSREISAYKTLVQYDRKIKSLGKQMGAIYDDKEMSASDKKIAILDIENRITIIARDANMWFNSTEEVEK